MPLRLLAALASALLATACVPSFRTFEEPPLIGPPCTATQAFGLTYSARLGGDDPRIVERQLPGLGSGVPAARLRLLPGADYAPFQSVIATLTPRSGRIAVVAAAAYFQSTDAAYAQLAEYRRLYLQQGGWMIKDGRVNPDGSTGIDVSSPLVLIRIALDTRPLRVDPADLPAPAGAVRLRMVCSDRQMETRAFGETLRALR